MSIFSPMINKRWMTYALLAADIVLFVWLIGYLAINFWPSETHRAQQTALAQQQPTALNLPKSSSQQTHNISIATQIQPNGSISQLFSANGLSHQAVNEVMQLQLASDYLSVVQPKQPIQLVITPKHQLQSLQAPLSGGKQLIIERNPNGLHARIQAPHYSKTLEYATATIHNSLSKAAYGAGIPAKLTSQLTHIFEQKINFKKDIRPGDHFNVLYEVAYHDGVKVDEGPIVAAEFVNRCNSHKAIRYKLANGKSDYFTPEGKSLKRLFLKAPLHYSRISSYFSYHRMDPIIHKIQAHLGVDFAAPRGTPVHSVSDGKVVFVGKRGGYGNAVVVQYGSHYKSLYGHLSRFAKHLHRGQLVSQGEVIAYVGSTGWSTGPHLHYSIYVDGRPQNPLTIKLPTGYGLPKATLAEFKSHSAMLLAKLNLYQGPQLTSANHQA